MCITKHRSTLTSDLDISEVDWCTSGEILVQPEKIIIGIHQVETVESRCFGHDQFIRLKTVCEALLGVDRNV